MATRAQIADVDRTVTAEIGRVVAAIDADVRANRERADTLRAQPRRCAGARSHGMHRRRCR